LTLGFKKGTIIKPLIEEKINFSFTIVYPIKRCARGVNVAPVARKVPRHERNGNRGLYEFQIALPNSNTHHLHFFPLDNPGQFQILYGKSPRT
jgi:hypothetical protein